MSPVHTLIQAINLQSSSWLERMCAPCSSRVTFRLVFELAVSSSSSSSPRRPNRRRERLRPDFSPCFISVPDSPRLLGAEARRMRLHTHVLRVATTNTTNKETPSAMPTRRSGGKRSSAATAGDEAVVNAAGDRGGKFGDGTGRRGGDSGSGGGGGGAGMQSRWLVRGLQAQRRLHPVTLLRPGAYRGCGAIPARSSTCGGGHARSHDSSALSSSAPRQSINSIESDG